MKNNLKSGILAIACTVMLASCSSNKTGDKVSDSLDAVHDSIRNDTSSYDITSQKDSSDTSSGADSAAAR